MKPLIGFLMLVAPIVLIALIAFALALYQMWHQAGPFAVAAAVAVVVYGAVALALLDE